MAAKMEFSDLDFFNVEAHWDRSIDDITLSQVCTDMENENDAFEKLEDLTLSQALDRYEVDAEMDTLPDVNLSSTFELAEVPLTADNIIEQLEKAVSTECKENSRYSFVDDMEVDKLVKSTESKNTRKNTNWSVATFEDWRGIRMHSTNCVVPELVNTTHLDINQWLKNL